jgi:hypothetical protein
MQTARTLSTFGFALSLVACAHDSYTTSPGGPASQERMATDAQECRQMAAQAGIHYHYATQSEVAGMFGLLGAAMAYSADPAKFSTPAPPPFDYKAAVEDCMRQRGYTPNADNRP